MSKLRIRLIATVDLTDAETYFNFEGSVPWDTLAKVVITELTSDPDEFWELHEASKGTLEVTVEAMVEAPSAPPKPQVVHFSDGISTWCEAPSPTSRTLKPSEVTCQECRRLIQRFQKLLGFPGFRP